MPGIKACQQYGYGGWDYIQILQHNKLFYMDMNGNITNTKPLSGGIPYGNDGGFPSTTYKIDKDNNGFVLHKEEVYPSYRRKGNKKTDYRITASNLYDSLLFLAPYERLLITKKDNLYGIAGYVIDENNKLLLLEEKVAPKYDAVEYVNRNHLKIRKNGLYNHFPTNDKPKYKKLEPFDEISENQINKFDLFIFILRSKKYNTPKNFINSNNELYKKLRKLPSMTIGVGENSKGSLSIRNVPEKNQKILFWHHECPDGEDSLEAFTDVADNFTQFVSAFFQANDNYTHNISINSCSDMILVP